MGDSERTEEDLLWHIPPPVKRESKIEEKKATAKTIVEDCERTLTKVETLYNMIAELEEEDPHSPEIENLRDELLDAEADYEASRKKSKSFAMTQEFGQEKSTEEMRNNTQARNWLGLSDSEDEEDLDPDSKSILVN